MDSLWERVPNMLILISNPFEITNILLKTINIILRTTHISIWHYQSVRNFGNSFLTRKKYQAYFTWGLKKICLYYV